MLRRQARLRRELVFKKSAKIKQNQVEQRRNFVEDRMLNQKAIQPSSKNDAATLQAGIKWKTDLTSREMDDDEYQYAGANDPKIVITTSHDPSSRLKMFAKEVRLIFPNAQKINRGKYEMKQLMQTCRANNVTDFIMIHENRGVPDTLIICHFPYGPTAFFNISDVVMRHDVPDIGPVSEQKPHLIFHNFENELGQRTKSILKHMFPVPKEDSKRVITFANHDDYITFRHHTFQRNKEVELKECGPRFQLKLFKIVNGTLDELRSANTEFVLRPYMTNHFKKRYLSNADGWS